MDMATTSMDETTEKEITLSVEKGPEEKARVLCQEVVPKDAKDSNEEKIVVVEPIDDINLSEIPKKEGNSPIPRLDGVYESESQTSKEIFSLRVSFLKRILRNT